MTHDELLAEWEKDAGIDKSRLDDEAANIPLLHHKYLSIYMKLRSRKVGLEHQLEEMKRDKELYYNGQATADVYKEKPFDLKLKTKSGVDKHVNTDPEVVKILQKIDYNNILLEGVNHILEQIKWRGSTVKTALDWIRFTSGEL